MDYPGHSLVDGPSPPDGTLIKKVLEHVVEVVELHAVLTSPRRQYLRRRLLQSLRSAMTIDEIEGFRREFGAQEYERHIHKLLRWGLVKPVMSGQDVTGYVRTGLGEEGHNTVRELQRKVGEERARSIAEAGLGSNAIKLFLTIFGNPKEADLTTREILYTPLEIGQLIRVFSRSVEGGAAIDKLDDAGLISYLEDGNVVQTRRSGLVSPDFVELPDFRSIKALSSANPMAGGVLETVRGCTEKCTYCQVIQQFLGSRLISRDTEYKRLEQLRELASDGLIHSSRGGKFQVFISDDLHPPPLRAVKYRDERLARLHGWKGRTDDMYMICQARAEIGQDPELANAMADLNIDMIYVGVETDNAEALKLVNKRQEPGQVHKDLVVLNEMGFSVVAMTIIGLPYDTEETIMAMADWVTQLSKYQTVHL